MSADFGAKALKSYFTLASAAPRAARAATLCLALLTGVSLIQTTAKAATRPISDFLSRQGKFCIQLGANGFGDCAASHYTSDTTGSGCVLFLPPVADYTGWTDPKGTSASFDYAGLADAALGGRLGTTMDGSIDELLQSDGSVLVKVVLRTQNALAFAWQGFDTTGPMLFGHRVDEILQGAPASVGSCLMNLVFRNPAPGAPLPDIEELFICRFNDLLFISFVGQANGTLSNGQPGLLQTTQTGLIATSGKANPNSRVALDAFPAEHIVIQQTGK